LLAAAATGIEDQPLAVPVTVGLVDTDGTESLAVTIAGVPAGYGVSTTAPGATFVTDPGTGVVTVTGTPAAITAALAGLVLTPGGVATHADANFSLTITATATESAANGAVATPTAVSSVTVPVTIRAVADAPTMGPGEAFTTNEDTAVTISGINVPVADRLDAALVDTDTSETLTTYRITTASLPPGATPAAGWFTSETGTAVGSFSAGAWTFTRAEFEAGVRFNPPGNLHGAFDFNLTATTVEAATGFEVLTPSASTTEPFTITVAPVLDAVSGTPTSTITVPEDSTSIAIGSALNLAMGDRTDTSQALSVTLTDIPADLDLTWTAAGGTVVNRTGTTVTISGGTGQNVLDTVASLRLSLTSAGNPTHRDNDIPIGVTVTATEAGGASNTLTGTTTIAVQAVADAPTLAGSGIGVEDQGNGDPLAGIPVAFTIGLRDTDGTEHLRDVVVSGFGANAVAAGSQNLTTALTADGQSVTLSGGAFDGVVVTRVAAGSYRFDSATLTGTARNAAIDAALDSIRIAPAANNSNAITLSVAATTEEFAPTAPGQVAPGGLTATTNGTVTVLVDAIADTPGVGGQALYTMTEDATLVAQQAWLSGPNAGLNGVTALSGALTDTVGSSETLSYRIELLSGPSGQSIAAGAFVNAAGTPVGSYTAASGPTPATWTFTAAQIASGIRFVPPANSDTRSGPGTHAPWSFDFVAVSNEANQSTAGLDDTTLLTDPETNQAESRRPFAIQVDPALDPASVAGSTTVNEDAVVDGANQIISFGSNVTINLNDNDGSEFLSEIRLAGLAGFAEVRYDTTRLDTLGAGGSITAGTVTITADGAGGYVLTTSATGTAATADLNAALDLFRVAAPQHRDDNYVVTVQAVSRDTLNPGGPAAVSLVTNHAITVRAVADAPVAVGGSGSGAEDAWIALPAAAGVGASADADISETLRVELRGFPVGTQARLNDGGVFTPVAVVNGVIPFTGTELQLNTLLNQLEILPPTHYSGPGINLTLAAISTEGATGGEVAVKTAETTAAIALTINAVTDVPNGALSRALGVEDTPVKLDVRGAQVDKDGSEVITTVTIGNLLPGAVLQDGAGNAYVPDGAGVYTFTGSQIDDVFYRPPANFDGVGPDADELAVTVTVAERTDRGVTVVGPATQTATLPLFVDVRAIADQPNLTVAPVVATEDQRIALGAAVTGSLVDLVGPGPGTGPSSETLSYLILGLPDGVRPVDAGGNPLGSFVGNGWQVTAAEMPLVHLPAIPDYSSSPGQLQPYDVTVRAVSQEARGGSQAIRDQAVSIRVNPVVDGATWNPSATPNEDAAIPLAPIAIAPGQMLDRDGSEQVLFYDIDLTAAAATARDGAGNPVSIGDFINATYISGTYRTVPLGGEPPIPAGSIRVSPADLTGLVLTPAGFADYNGTVTMPVTAHIRDTGNGTTVDGTSSATFAVDFVGVADQPTVSVPGGGVVDAIPDITANLRTPIIVPLGGARGESDTALGRASESESLYYFVSGLAPMGTALPIAFVDGSNQLVGLNNGDGTWYFSEADMATPGGIRLIHGSTTLQDVTLTLTSVVVENDRSPLDNRETASAPFTVRLLPTEGGGAIGDPTPPPVPLLTGLSSPTGTEDEAGGMALAGLGVSRGPGDTTSSLSIVIPNASLVAAGATIAGAIYNPQSDEWVIPEAELPNVRITGPEDFSGALSIANVRALASNVAFQQTASAPQTLTITVTPDAADLVFAASPAAGVEDQPAALNLSLVNGDTDATPESISGNVTLTVLTPGVTLLRAGTPLVEDSPGVYTVAPGDLAGLQVQGPADWHGTARVRATATVVDGGQTRGILRDVDVVIAADADAPILTQPANVTGAEDAPISLVNLSATLADAVVTNGGEELSVRISGLPPGTQLSAGANNGPDPDNPGFISWTVPAAALATLQLTAPEDFAGVINARITAFAIESSNGDRVSAFRDFTVTVTPVADTLSLFGRDIAGGAAVPVQTNLGLVLNDPDERVELSFTGLPAAAMMTASGGAFFDRPDGTRVFVGTKAEADSIDIRANTPGSYDIAVSAVTIDGTDRLAAPVTSGFTLVASAPAGSQTVTGTAGPDTWLGSPLADTLNGGDGSDYLAGGLGNDTLNGGNNADVLVGGQGADAMTGGTGADTFRYLAGDAAGGPDTITGASFGVGGDVLDLDQLLAPAVTPAISNVALAGYLQIVNGGGNATIRVDVDGGGDAFVDLAIVQGATLDLATLRANGNLVV
jgi:hypothetical protein